MDFNENIDITKHDRLNKDYNLFEAYDNLRDDSKYGYIPCQWLEEHYYEEFRPTYISKSLINDEVSKDAYDLINSMVDKMNDLINETANNLYFCPHCGTMVLRSETKTMLDGSSGCEDCYNKQ